MFNIIRNQFVEIDEERVDEEDHSEDLDHPEIDEDDDEDESERT